MKDLRIKLCHLEIGGDLKQMKFRMYPFHFISDRPHSMDGGRLEAWSFAMLLGLLTRPVRRNRIASDERSQNLFHRCFLSWAPAGLDFRNCDYMK